MEDKTLIDRAILKESIFIVGSVSSVEGRKVKVRVNKDKNLSHISYQGTLIKNVSVGSYIKITKGFIEIIGKVEGEYVTYEKNINEEYQQEEQKIDRFLDVSLFGHFDEFGFKQGIKEMPLIDNQCFLLDKLEFNKLHQFHKDNDQVINIGCLSDEPSQEIKLSISKLFASHIGIFGNTGSGKSNTLARVYSELFTTLGDDIKSQFNSKFVWIDFNGEYTKKEMLCPEKVIYNLSTSKREGDRYPISRENIERLEIVSVLLEATEKTQKPFLNRALRNSYLDEDFIDRSKENIKKIIIDVLQKGDSNLNIGIFSELFSHLGNIDTGTTAKDILSKLESGTLKYHGGRQTYYVSEPSEIYANSDLDGLYNSFFGSLSEFNIDDSNFNKLKFKILSQYHHEITNGYSNQEHIKPLIGRMFKKFDVLSKIIRIHEENSVSFIEPEVKNIEVINLKDVNLEMKKTLPLIIVKQLYDKHKNTDDFEKRSLHIVVDEAHNILSSSSERESETWKDYRLETFEEIIKEGRKFSTFLTVASQRPYDISPTIISQLHNYFIHRLINDNDIKAIEKTIAYLDRLSFESIPVLPIGSCFVAGLALNIPVKVDINLLDDSLQPKSETINLQDAWFNTNFNEDEANF